MAKYILILASQYFSASLWSSKLFLFVFSRASFPIPFGEFLIVFVEEIQVFWNRILCDF